MQFLYNKSRCNTDKDITQSYCALQAVSTMEFYKEIMGKWPINHILKTNLDTTGKNQRMITAT